MKKKGINECSGSEILQSGSFGTNGNQLFGISRVFTHTHTHTHIHTLIDAHIICTHTTYVCTYRLINRIPAGLLSFPGWGYMMMVLARRKTFVFHTMKERHFVCHTSPCQASCADLYCSEILLPAHTMKGNTTDHALSSTNTKPSLCQSFFCLM